MSDEKNREAKSSILIFTQKLLIFFLVLLIALYISLPSLEKAFSTERNKLLVLGLIQNPAALYKASEIEEQGGHLVAARREMELAVGLVEMHSADKQVLKCYSDRLEVLKRRIEGPAANPTR